MQITTGCRKKHATPGYVSARPTRSVLERFLAIEIGFAAEQQLFIFSLQIKRAMFGKRLKPNSHLPTRKHTGKKGQQSSRWCSIL
jgi:hypothetical protein